MADLRPSKMPHHGRMAGLVKQLRREKPLGQCSELAGSDRQSPTRTSVPAALPQVRFEPKVTDAGPCVNVRLQSRSKDARRLVQFDFVPDAMARFALTISAERLCKMTAFVIGQMQIHSRDWMDEYFSKIPEVVARHRGQFLVRGGDPESLEGDNALPDAAFIIEFPDRSFAKDFWGSKEFQALAVLRRTGSSLNAILVDRLA